MDLDPFRSASDLARALRRKALSPVEVVRHYLARIDARDGALNAFTWRRDAELFDEARVAEAQLKTADPAELPPFFGVPIPIKDLTETRGHPTTHGSRVAKAKIGRYDSTAVRLIREAGFLVLGRTNSPEFGTLPVTENELYGATRNPWNAAKTPGGSSGGAAAAVAAGMAPIAHASDGGGSIRIPASCCGLVGLKASRARIPKGPYLTETMNGFSTDGCVSTTIEDTAAMLDALAWRDPHGWYGIEKPAVPFAVAMRQRPARLRIGIATMGPIPQRVEPSVVDAVMKTGKLLESLGHHVFEAAPDWAGTGEQLALDFTTVWATGTAYLDFPDLSELEFVNAGLREICKAQSSLDYLQAVARMQLFSRRVTGSFGRDFDLLLTPTLAMEPPDVGWLFETGTKDAVEILKRSTELVPYCGWCNVTGQPAISLPTTIGASGLPIGVQLVAPPLREDLLLQVGRELEELIDWSARLPRSS